jgi:NitT/TauT family transport system ATP-binding protein
LIRRAHRAGAHRAATAPPQRSALVASKGHIEVSGLSVRFAKAAAPAISGIDLDVRTGQFVCLLGQSGCGKSTLLNAIAGFVRPSAGSIAIDGQAVDGPGADRGMVFQQPQLFPWKTVLGNVAFGPRMAGHSGIEAERTARTFIDMVGLMRSLHRYPGQLSGGMQQRVCIARALANYPRVLLMDEPFGALDAQTRTMMQQALLRLWSDFRITVVFVTHDIDEAVFLADRIIVMGGNPGRIVDDIAVALPRPRAPEAMFLPDFIAAKRRCHELIRAETLLAFQDQGE